MKINDLEKLLVEASHDLKSPLSSIKSLLFIAKNNLEKKKKAHQEFKKIEEKITLLNSKIDDFLDFIYFKEKIFQFSYEFFDLRQILTLKKGKKNFPVMADKKYLKKSLDKLINDSRIQLKVNKKGYLISLTRKEKLEEDSDKIGVYTALSILKLHGGKLQNLTNRKYLIFIPYKAKRIS